MLMKHEGDYGFHLHHQQETAIHGHRRTRWGTVMKLYPYIYIYVYVYTYRVNKGVSPTW